MITCSVCSNLIQETAKLLSDRFSILLREYCLTDICRSCYDIGRKLFRKDLEDFWDWLDENDNRPYSFDYFNEKSFLRKGYGMSESLMSEDHEEFQMCIDKYASDMESMVIWMAKKTGTNLVKAKSEFVKFKNTQL